MTDDGPQPSRRRLVVATAAAVLLLLGAGGVALLTGGPAPRLATIRQEPLLVAPVDAVELGREEQQSQWGLGLPDAAARVRVAYRVPGSIESAARSWLDAYGEQYGLTSAYRPDGLRFTGTGEDVAVSVVVAETVENPGGEGDFAPPEPGGAVVTVVVTAG
ncbi:hypothetical protein [Cellulomonas triticagri]|uniref:Uncharacterized protein n=1 Tax=Cellulomonas triticagri TaxID=2483352 RepID=A0A3M2J9E2_9CELL|nr:hypothetical protein [Cellulomonas triticagri]RMI08691.1 hypothetical protein EBM89_13465 [Cellulomonas triticagri]